MYKVFLSRSSLVASDGCKIKTYTTKRTNFIIMSLTGI